MAGRSCLCQAEPLQEHLWPLDPLRVNKRAARAVWFVVNEYLSAGMSVDLSGGHLVMLERREG